MFGKAHLARLILATSLIVAFAAVVACGSDEAEPVAAPATAATAVVIGKASEGPAVTVKVEAPAPSKPSTVSLVPTATAVAKTAAPAPTAVAVSPGAEQRELMSGSVHKFKWDGPTPSTFQEAPMLAEKVAAGDLPAVRSRLPISPAVILPVERTGDYGGTWRRAFTGPNDNENIHRLSPDHPIMLDTDGVQTYGNLFESWDINSDSTVFTFHLRQGVRWSDGAYHKASDWDWTFKNITCNTDIAPDGQVCAIGGSSFVPTKFEAVDDYTIRYTFAESTPAFLDGMASTGIGFNLALMAGGRGTHYPVHYMKQFHPATADATALAKEIKDAGATDWVELWKIKANARRNTELPTIAPWHVTAPNTGQSWEWERNPYWYVTDTDGNQLPYIDRIVMTLTADTEVLNLKAMSGEIDYQQRHIMLDKYPLFKDNEAKGNYTVRLNPNWRGDGIIFNQTWDGDPVIAKLLQTAEFRQALALGVDREAFIEAFWLGLGSVRNGQPFPTHPWYLGAEYDTMWNYLDIDTSNKMLDDLGLSAKDSDGFRLRPDGDGTLILELDFVSAYFQNFEGMSDLLRSQWTKIGIKLNPVGKDVSLYAADRDDNKNMIVIGGMTGGREPNNPTSDGDFSALYKDWWASGGKSGLEPTGDLLRLGEIAIAARPLLWRDRGTLYKEGFKIIIENQYRITFQHGAPGFMGTLVIKNNFHNTQGNVGDILHIPKSQRPDQFFFEGGKNDSQ